MRKHVPIEERSISAGQVGKFLDLQAVALRKSDLPSKQIQLVLELQGRAVADEFVTALAKRVELARTMMTRTVTPKRGTWYRPELTIHFFSLDRPVNDLDLQKEFALRCLRATEFSELRMFNECDPAFARKYPCATHQQVFGGKWHCHMLPGWYEDGALVNHGEYEGSYPANLWFAGMPAGS
jgi:hypothetical protein